MKKGQQGEGIVEKISFPNKGIVKTEDGTRVIVKNTIPGQKVSFICNKARHKTYEGRLVEVLEKSPLETEEICPHFGICGGCSYLSLPYEQQISLKEKEVKELLEPVLSNYEISWEQVFEGVKESPRRLEYRNKMEFTFGDEFKDGPLALGMHKKGSFYDLVTVKDCQIVDGDFRKVLTETLTYFTEQQVPYMHRMRHEGYLRHLLVRKATKTKEILVDLVTTSQMDKEKEKTLLEGWVKYLLSQSYEGSIRGLLHTHNDNLADAVIDEGTVILYGDGIFEEELLGLHFNISPFSFFQTNSLGAEVLYETAREFVMESYKNKRGKEMKGATLYDLYSGTGTIAQMMAPACGQVVGVEIVEEAVEAAKENAKRNHLSNCKFLAGDVLKCLDDIEELPDYIILDPPRDGIHPKALEKIIAYGVESMVYISCKPSSLARDLEVFLGRGYTPERVCCVDMFPGTYHVETVCLLSKKA